MNSAMAVSAPQCKFIGLHHSVLTDHGQCCKLAKNWLLSMHLSHTFVRTNQQQILAPLWLKRYFTWGPVQWPISWCEAVQKKTIDCGVFAAFAVEIFTTSLKKSGLINHEVFPAQIILDQPQTFIEQWNTRWNPIFRDFNWIGDAHVYHEVCALVDTTNDTARIYDPTEGIWYDPSMERGINNVIGVNIRSPRMVKWGDFSVGQDQWALL